MKKTLLVLFSLAMSLSFISCSNKDKGIEDYTNPGDNLNGGGSSTVAPTSEGVNDIVSIVNDYKTTVLDNESSVEKDNPIAVDLSSLTKDYSIKDSGCYVFSNTTTYKIVIAKKGIDIHLFLENATFDSIFSDKKANSTIITVTGENTMTGTDADLNSDAKGTLNVKGNLVINGSGKLSINSAAKNGIHCTGNLKIMNCELVVNAYKHGIRSNGYMVIDSGKYTITTVSGDGIQTDNELAYSDIDSDATSFADITDAKISEYLEENDRYILINDGDFTIDSKDDGISSATGLYIKNGDIEIKTNGGAPTKVTETSSDNADGKAIKTGTLSYAVNDSILSSELNKGNREDSGEDEDSESIIDILTQDYYPLVISNGALSINSNDDAIHSNGDLVISGGNITVATGDDAVHAEGLLGISNGTIDVSKCYEGVEASKIEVSGGDITVVASDDGINAADGTENRMGQTNSNCYIIISGGNVKVNASGDGLDSNGSMLISGGTVYVDGPTSNADTALDSDGGILIDGGTVVAVGSSGMVETPAQNSKQCVISYASNTSIKANTTLTLKDSSGNTLVEFTTAKACQSMIMSDENIQIGKSYSLYNGDTLVKTFSVSSTITYIGTQNIGNNPGGMQNQPGWGFNGGMGRR